MAMPCLSTSNPTAQHGRLGRAAQGHLLARKTGDHPGEDQPVGGESEQHPRQSEQDFRPRLLGQPEKRQHRPGESGQQAGDRERDGQGEPQTEQRQ
jgi:hypothetical protein